MVLAAFPTGSLKFVITAALLSSARKGTVGLTSTAAQTRMPGRLFSAYLEFPRTSTRNLPTLLEMTIPLGKELTKREGGTGCSHKTTNPTRPSSR